MSVYLITGAARGIGLELACQLSSNASTTIIATVRTVSPELQRLHDERKNIRIVTCDISSTNSISLLSTSLSSILTSGEKITHVLNNAGIVAHREVQATSITTEAIMENMTTNVLGPAKIVEIVLPFLAENASIVNISSGMGSLQLCSEGIVPTFAAGYSISKAALNMLSVHQAHELKGQYRVVCVDPGHVKTRLGGDQAGTEIDESAAGIIKVVQGLEKDEQGDRDKGRARFLDFLGKELPW